MADPVSDEEAEARVRAALGIREIDPNDPPEAVVAPAKKAAPRKKPAKKVAAKKAPAKRARKAVAPPPEPEPEPPAEPGMDLAVIEAQAADIAELEHPAFKAWEMKQQGLTWEEIADRSDTYRSAATAAAGVLLWLQNGALAAGREVAESRAQLSLDRVERVISAAWDKAMGGDKDMLAIVLKANADFYRMAGLERAPVKVSSKQTIVIGGGPEMAAELRAAAEEQDRQRIAAEREGVFTDVGDDDD